MKDISIPKAAAIALHRNGINGAPFHVVLFDDRAVKGRKVACVFAEPGHVAVLDVAKLAAGDIAFGSNSWRGDQYEAALRRLVSESDDGESQCRSHHLARGLAHMFANLMDEIQSEGETSFTREQVDFLERRLAEIQFTFEDAIKVMHGGAV